MDPLQMSGTDLVQLSDDDLGLWLVASWLAFQAEKAGIARDAIPQEWARAIVAASAAMDSDSVKNAPMESMFRKACTGDLSAAGRMLRTYLLDRAATGMMERHADAGLKQAVGRKEGGLKAGRAKKEGAAEWQARCVDKALKLLASGRSPRDLAGILAPQFDVTPTTVRAVLKKAKVK